LEQGPYARDIVLASLRWRQPIPPVIENAPELWFGLGIFRDAFWDLDNERPSNYGRFPRRIPRSAIRGWIEEKGITDPELIERLYFHVRRMDGVFIEHVAETVRAQEAENNGANNPPG
jgi:hypothetical protein